MTVEQMREILALVDFPAYKFEITEGRHGAIYLQASYMDNDVVTHKPEIQRTRRWFLSPEMVKSEIVSTAFKCIITSAEHRVREHFTYRGKRIFGPHFDVDALYEICNKQGLDYRGKDGPARTPESGS